MVELKAWQQRNPACTLGLRSKDPEDNNIESLDKALLAAGVAQDKKGQDLTVIDVAKDSSYTDYVVLVTATSERQTRAIAESTAEVLKREHGILPLSREGDASWALIDYGDVVLHVFEADARAYYDLDGLFKSSRRVPVPAATA